MRLTASRFVFALLAGASILSCSETITRPIPSQAPRSAPAARADGAGTTPQIVISQIYGGGGNSGATYTNDFVELFNPGGQPVTVDGWSVQYASATGWTWQATPISGTIPPGGYYLVQEARGTGGSTPLPTPNASGSIAMSATAGKVVLAIGTSPLGGLVCPNSAAVVDRVSFGTTATNCAGMGTTATLSNSTAALRKDLGCAYTANLALDFAVGAPAPRNSATPRHVCSGALPLGPLDHVTVAGAQTVLLGDTTRLIALPQDSNNQTIPTATVTWSSSDPARAAVDATGLVTGVAVTATPVTITATATDSGITKSGSQQLTVNLPAIAWLDVSSSGTSFPPGFQTQLFATARVSNGGLVIPANFTFEAVDPGIATITTVANTGIITGVAASATKPGFRITATPIGGGTPYTFTAHPVTIETPVAAPPTIYGTNDEFGDPTPAGADPNDMLIARPQYTISYNQSRGTPNWVSYELDARQTGGEDRCNCFTADPLLPADHQIFTSDYTNGGYDRGHLTRSADRTAGNVDNASTFYLTNIIPQTADLNQGVWAQFENALADSARAGRAVYIIAGPLYSRSHGLTFLKGEGKVAVPDSAWKVAIIGPRSAGLPFTRGTLQTWGDLAGLTVLAASMPNATGVHDDPWSKYLTTIDRIEAATGYDLLSLLAVSFQDAVEAGDHSPVARFSASAPAYEGTAVTFDASASSDPDLGRGDLPRTEALSYAWHFSDGGQAAGSVVTRTFPDNGDITATLVVTDAFGWESTATHVVGVANVAPTVSLAATTPLSILSGDSVVVSGSFSDPGADAPWQALLDWGNGSSAHSTWNASGAVITGQSRFFGVGDYTVTLSVSDKDGATGSASLAVAVARRPVTGEANPKSISVAETDGDIKVTLYSAPGADVSTLDLRTVRVGSVTLGRAHVDASAGSYIVLRFPRQALIAAGLLTRATTELVVTGDLAGGVQIVSHVPVAVH